MSFFQLAFLFLITVHSVDQNKVLSSFESDEKYVRAAIDSGDVASAMIASSSVLYHWQDSPLFGELIDHIILRAYKEKPAEDLRADLAGRLSLLQEGMPWEVWLETGLIALAAGHSEDAGRCFSECLKDEAFRSNPYSQLLMGRSFLARDEVSEAQPFYRAAINAASQDLSTAFYIRYLHAADLYKDGRISLTQCDSGPLCGSYSSPYSLERAYGIYETAMYAWSIGDSVEVSRLATELEETLKEAQPRADSPFEKRRFDEATNFLRRVKAANAGDEYIAMILDEEACEYDRWSHNQSGVYKRLVKWRELHPIEEYSGLEEKEQKFALTSVHISLNVVTCQLGLFEEAEAGFRAFLDVVPFEENGEMVSLSRLWLGYTLHLERRYQEALDMYDKAASDIPPETFLYPGMITLIDLAHTALETEKERKPQ